MTFSFCYFVHNDITSTFGHKFCTTPTLTRPQLVFSYESDSPSTTTTWNER